MKSPKILHAALNPSVQKPRHSSLLLWAVLIMVMLSGLLYVGSQVKELRMEKPFVPANNPSPDLSESITSNPHKSVPLTFDKILATLKSQQLINPVLYKTHLILKSDGAHDDLQHRDALWQSGQRQFILIQATVRAGVDLSELTQQSLQVKSPAILHLPPARIQQTQIDRVTTYDVKTGQPSTVQMGLSLTSDQEKNIRTQIEQEFCQSGVLRTATEDTQQHVIELLDQMNVSLIVRVVEPIGCGPAAS